MSSTTKKHIRSNRRTSQQKTSRRRSTGRTPARTPATRPHGLGVDIGALPQWKDLAAGNRKRRAAVRVPRKTSTLFETISTVQFAAVLLVAALMLGIYVHHVFATRDALSQFEQQRREHLQLQLEYNRLKGAVDRALSPNQIYHRARALGLEPGVQFEAVIRVPPVEDE